MKINNLTQTLGTQDVQIVPCTLEKGEKIYLIDTPGFDDQLRSDTEILREVASWLTHAHKSNLKLSGIIYLQRVTDPRIGGSGIRNIRMFKKLCGEDGLPSVVLATTFWNYFSDLQAAIDRETQYMSEAFLWKPMIDQGSKVFRHDKKEVSARSIVQYLIERKLPIVLDIQREMVDQDMLLGETGAGGELASGVEKEKQWFEKKLGDLQKHLNEALASRDKSSKEEIEEHMAEIRHKLELRDEDKKRLDADTAQLYREMEKRYETEMKQLMKAIHEKELAIQETQMQVTMMRGTHAAEMELQKLQLQMKLKAQYRKMLHDSACTVM
jgi:hypothetical protein